MGYVVTAGFVTVETAVGGGRAEIDIPRGSPLPADVPAETVSRLLGQQSIAPSRAAKVAKAIVADHSAVPTGTISDVLAWVDGDPGRAAAVLAAESAKGDGARATLVAALNKLTQHTESPVDPE